MGKSLIHSTFKTKEDAERAAKYVKPGHWRITKVKGGWRLHITK